MRSKYYYEAHVTIEPVFDDARDRAAVLAKLRGFKLAHLLMKKRSEETAVRSDKDTFMTGHGTDLLDITERLAVLVRDLQQHGYQVWRYKIEDTVCDSRISDELNLLSEPQTNEAAPCNALRRR